MPGSLRRLVVVLFTGSLALVSCGGPPEVPPPSPDAADAGVCEGLMPALPNVVYDESTREVTPTSSLTTAWGDPAIVLRCGVDRPPGYQPTADLATVNGVDWFPEQLSDGYRFTTWGRQTNVEVFVPQDYAPEVNPLVDLAPAVKQYVPKTDHAYD